MAIDTDADGDFIDIGLITYYGGAAQRWVPAFTAFPETDNFVLVYDAASDSFIWDINLMMS